ncbi:MAG: hypothetical protein AB2L22_07725 [Syntrophales bacterium]
METMTIELGMERVWSDRDMLGGCTMETVTVEAGTERVWSDQDRLSQGGYGPIPHDEARPGSALRVAAKLEGTFERVWSDDDALSAISTLKKAA